MAYRIVVDSGHGGEDPGAVYQGRQEKDDTLQLGLAVGEILKENGVDVIFTRTEDIYQTPFQKAQIANEAMADYFVSIHRNSSPRPNQYEGVETLVYDKSGIKLEMAENINSALEDVGFKNLGVKARPGLVVLRRTKMPALLVDLLTATVIISFLMKNLTRLPRRSPGEFWELWRRRLWKNLFCIVCRWDCFGIGRMQIT